MPSIPKPFQRPSVSLGAAPGAKKEWREVTADEIHLGDLIQGHGVVQRISETDGYLTFETPSYILDDNHPTKKFFAFVAVRG